LFAYKLEYLGALQAVCLTSLVKFELAGS